MSRAAAEHGQNPIAGESHLYKGINKFGMGGLVVVSGGDCYRSLAEALTRKPFRLKKREEKIGSWDVLTAAVHAFIRHHLSPWL